jgi:hypothetical protein
VRGDPQTLTAPHCVSRATDTSTGSATIIEIRAAPDYALMALMDEILIQNASTWGYFSIWSHSLGMLPTPENTADIEERIREIGSNSGQLAIAPYARADVWLPWASTFAKRHHLRLTVTSGAYTPRAFRRRAVELNAKYIKRQSDGERIHLRSLGDVAFKETAEDVAKLHEARRQCWDAHIAFDQLSVHRQGEKAN